MEHTGELDLSNLSERTKANHDVVGKIQQAMALFGPAHVGNLILRQGKALEFETSVQGKVEILSFAGHESINLDGEGGDANHQESEPVAGVDQPFTRAEMMALFELVDRDWREKIKDGGLDGPIRFEGMSRYRAHLFLFGGEINDTTDAFRGLMGAFIRIIPAEIVPLKSLGLPTYMSVLGDENWGLLLICGPTGAGKTTTMASYIDHVNKTRVGHIVTIEDPIEYNMIERNCRVTQREVGSNVRDLETGVRDAMRELPLAIMVGEVRDSATLLQTMRAAMSGHYVATTKHAPNAVAAVRAIVDELPGDSAANAAMVAQTLLGVIYQVRTPSTKDGSWEFAFECLNVTSSEPAQDCITRQDWTGLKKHMEKPEDKKAQLLNKSLMALIEDGKIIAESADRRTYDRVGLRHLASPKK